MVEGYQYFVLRDCREWILSFNGVIFVFSFCNDLLNFNTISLLISFIFATWEHSEWEEEFWIILFYFLFFHYEGKHFDWQEKNDVFENKKKNWNKILFIFPSHSWKFFPLKIDFQKIAKAFSVNLVQKVKFAKLKSAKFREFQSRKTFCTQNFLPLYYTSTISL